MMTEAIDKILSLSAIQVQQIGGLDYVKRGQEVIRLKKPEHINPLALVFNTLAGLVDYIKSNPDDLDLAKLVFHVSDFDRVDLLGPLQDFNDNIRFCYASAVMTRPGFPFGQWFQLEECIIRLQTEFVHDPELKADTETIIEHMGKVANEKLTTHTDDGVTQTIQVRSGLTTLSGVRVANPVLVYPWRTFREVKQPGIVAVLRYRQSGEGKPLAALFESDGGGWRLDAIEAIANWLKDLLPTIKVLA
jgi:hypothetical protein